MDKLVGPASPVQLEVWGRHCSCSIPASPVLTGSSGISIASPTIWLLALSGPRLQLARPGLCQLALARWQPGKRSNPLHLRDPPPQFGKGGVGREGEFAWLETDCQMRTHVSPGTEVLRAYVLAACVCAHCVSTAAVTEA